jgi:hypothetical protein
MSDPTPPAVSDASPAVAILARMAKALEAGRGVRLSNDDLHTLHVTVLAEVMSNCGNGTHE